MGRWWAVSLVLVVAIGCTSESVADNRPELVRSIRDPDEEVFMTIDAGPEQIAIVRDTIRRSALIRRYAFLSRADSYREFRRIFREIPVLIAVTDPTTFPVSFRLDLVDRDDRARFARLMQRLPGVDEVRYIYTRAERLRLRRDPAP